jgi:hypothetical protein
MGTDAHLFFKQMHRCTFTDRLTAVTDRTNAAQSVTCRSCVGCAVPRKAALCAHSLLCTSHTVCAAGREFSVPVQTTDPSAACGADLLVNLVKDSLAKMVRTIFSNVLSDASLASDAAQAASTPSVDPGSHSRAANGHSTNGRHTPGNSDAPRGYGVQSADSILQFLIKLVEVRAFQRSAAPAVLFTLLVLSLVYALVRPSSSASSLVRRCTYDGRRALVDPSSVATFGCTKRL